MCSSGNGPSWNAPFCDPPPAPFSTEIYVLAPSPHGTSSRIAVLQGSCASRALLLSSARASQCLASGYWPMIHVPRLAYGCYQWLSGSGNDAPDFEMGLTAWHSSMDGCPDAPPTVCPASVALAAIQYGRLSGHQLIAMHLASKVRSCGDSATPHSTGLSLSTRPRLSTSRGALQPIP